MRILWYHWKDITHPSYGGAEVLSHEVSKRLVKKGFDITQFCSSYPSAKKEEIIDGVKIVRDGGKYSVYIKAKNFYKKNKENFDVIIDEINTRPFLTPDFVTEPVIALIHQLAREVWFYETRFPLNLIGYYFLENYWLRKYRTIPTITVSKSTENDLKKLQFEKIKIIPEGLSCKPLEKIAIKESLPTLIYVGRFKKTKLPDHAIKSFLEIKKEIKDAQLWMVGDGDRMKILQNFAKSNSIKFWGRVSNEKKIELMSRAHLILVPSIKEGWGLVVIEANAMGTPAVAYNVDGLRDSVQNNVNGILTPENNVFSLAESALKLLNDKKKLDEMSQKSLHYARQFSWDITANVFEQYLNSYVSK